MLQLLKARGRTLILLLFIFPNLFCLTPERRQRIKAIFTECPCYEETVAFPGQHTAAEIARAEVSREEETKPNEKPTFGLPAGAAKEMGTSAYLDKMYEGMKADFEGSGLRLTPIPNGFHSTGINVERIQENNRTRELLVSIDGDISFAHGSSLVTPQAQAVLEKVGKALNAYPDIQIKVGGHTDSTGSRGLNLPLSRARAQAVADQLVNLQHVARTRIVEVNGYADDQKIVNTMAAEVRNRRVEIRMAP